MALMATIPMNASRQLLRLMIAAWLLEVTASARDVGIDWLSLDGGGGTSTGRVFAVSGTIGQLDAVRLVGNRHSVDGGFWSVLAPAVALPQNQATNGGFENPENSFNSVNGAMSLPEGSTLVPGWTTVNAELAWVSNTNSFGPTSPYGGFFLDLTGFHDSKPYGGVARTLSTVPNQRYRFSFSLGTYYDTVGFRGPVSVEVVVSGVSSTFTFVPEAVAGGSRWMTFGWEFVAVSTNTQVAIAGAASTGGQFIGLDDLSIISQTSGVELLSNASLEDLTGGFWQDANGVMLVTEGMTAIPGWTTVGPGVIWGRNNNFFGLSTPYGTHFLDLTGYQDHPPFGGVAQTIATTPNHSYHLSFALGLNQDVAAYRGPVSASVTAGASGTSFTFTPQGSADQWADFSMDFTAVSDSTPISIVGLSSGGGQYLGLDNVFVTPLGPASTSGDLYISKVNLVGGTLELEFFGESGLTFAVESASEIGTQSWITVPGSAVVGSGEVLRIALTNAPTLPQQFFRVKRLP